MQNYLECFDLAGSGVEETSNELEYICKLLRSCKRFIVHYFNPFSIFLSNCVLFFTLKCSCKGVGMEDKISFTLCCFKREVALAFIFNHLSTPTLWSLMLSKPLNYVDWPFVTQVDPLLHCTLK